MTLTQGQCHHHAHFTDEGAQAQRDGEARQRTAVSDRAGPSMCARELPTVTKPAHLASAASSGPELTWGPGRGPQSTAGQAAQSRVPGLLHPPAARATLRPSSEQWSEQCQGHAWPNSQGALSPGSSSDLTGDSISRAKKLPTSLAPLAPNDLI